MSRLILLITILLLVLNQGCSWFKKPADSKKDEEMSYYMGLQLGQSLKKQGIKVDVDKVVSGIEDGYEGGEDIPSEKEVNDKMMEFILKRHTQKNADVLAKEEEAKKYLEKNQTRKGVSFVNQEVQFEVLKTGKGASPRIEDRVDVRMRTQLMDGKEVSKDTNFKEYQMIELLPGVRDALKQANEGSTIRVYMSSLMAYGARGGEKVPPGSGIIVDVELRKVIPAIKGKAPHL